MVETIRKKYQCRNKAHILIKKVIDKFGPSIDFVWKLKSLKTLKAQMINKIWFYWLVHADCKWFKKEV